MNNVKRNAYALEVKALAADGTFAGYASVFNTLDNQRDIVRPGAFAATLAKRNYPVQLLWQHQWDSPIGVISRVFEDRRGLYVEGQLLLDVAKGNDAYALLKGGAIRGLSIGFTVQKAAQNIETGVRELLAVDLWEVSLVTLPANDAATVTVVKSRAKKRRSPASQLDALLDELLKAEKVLLGRNRKL